MINIETGMQMNSLSRRVEPGDTVEIGTDAEVDVSAFNAGMSFVVHLDAAWPAESETKEYEVTITRLSGDEQFEAAGNAAHVHLIRLKHDCVYIELIEQ